MTGEILKKRIAMISPVKSRPTIFIIFGATGDLTSRKIIPALYNLFLGNWMPDNFSIIGTGRTKFTDDTFRKKLLAGVSQFSRKGKAEKKQWSKFSSHLFYQVSDLNEVKGYTAFGNKILKYTKEWKQDPQIIYYMAVSPNFFPVIAENIYKNKLVGNVETTRIVIEKPFGHDLKSAKDLNSLLQHIFDESQIYRIDHYLGKETVQNILAFRFANAMYEPIWNRNYIDSIQITVSEQIGIENRGSYYESAGALRDMIQNHLLQILCLITMEPPVSFEAEEVRNRKVDVLNALRNIPTDEVHQFAVRGQYGPGWIEGKQIKGYRHETDVDRNSTTETFAAIKLYIDNWRWQDVPFYLRSGKRMNETNSVITIQFKPIPHQSFSSEASGNWEANRLILNIQPRMSIRFRFQAKRPGLQMVLFPVDMQFNYDDYSSSTPEAYETLLLDIIEGDSTLFMRADQVEAAWKALMPIINVWKNSPSVNFPDYEAGMQGPEDAEALIAKDGHNWVVMPHEKINQKKNGRSKQQKDTKHIRK